MQQLVEWCCIRDLLDVDPLSPATVALKYFRIRSRSRLKLGAAYDATIIPEGLQAQLTTMWGNGMYSGEVFPNLSSMLLDITHHDLLVITNRLHSIAFALAYILTFLCPSVCAGFSVTLSRRHSTSMLDLISFEPKSCGVIVTPLLLLGSLKLMTDHEVFFDVG